MSRHLSYLSYVIRHKWYVLKAGIELKVPLLTLILHDWDKFLPDEWVPYARTFYNRDGSKRYKEFPEFATAWNAHQKQNKHHWQWWMLTWDRGETEYLPMPDRYRREMLADWRGAGKAIMIGNIHDKKRELERGECTQEQHDAYVQSQQAMLNTWEWYAKNRENIKLHPDTRAWLEAELEKQRTNES